ncbi:phosphopyruvate hydratase [Gammaproteobacteria bacterium]|nr:phosphopyruvate hydratase [Gammaproteobacteria bacterium]
MFRIKKIIGRQIIDSRGNPTCEADITLDDGTLGRGAVPSGASTGKLEAIEIRDNDPDLYLGKSVNKAVDNINHVISAEINSSTAFDQESFDKFLIELDGTSNKERLGANTILALSIAFAKAIANKNNIHLYQSLTEDSSYMLPIPMMNIINGGAHANNKLDFQEFMILPIGFDKITESIRAGAEIFHTLKNALNRINMPTSVGDEGGFAPNLNSNSEAIDIILDSISKAGYNPGKDIYLGLDVASSEFYEGGAYVLESENLKLSSDEFITYLCKLRSDYPIISIEDGLAEDDWSGWEKLTKRLGTNTQLVGDDLFVTNPKIFKKGIQKDIANSILIKLNQIGTITETLEAITLARDNNYNYIISHRSGETEDVTIADLSVATSSGLIKTGSMSRSDRVAKYNQLIRIEENIGTQTVNNKLDKYLR